MIRGVLKTNFVVTTLRTGIFFLFPPVLFILSGLFILELSSYKLKYIILENFLFSLLCGLFISLITNLRFKTIVAFIAYLIIAVKIFIEVSYYHLYTYTINTSTIFILIETNLAESAEYLTSYITAFNIILFIALFTPLVFIRFFLGYEPVRYRFQYYLVIISMIVGTAFFYQFKNLGSYNLYTIGWTSYHEYVQVMSLYDKYHLHRPTGGFEDVTFNQTSQRQIFVLVLGESTTKHRMGIFGYDRPTNPKLEELRKELILFQDVISPHTHTIGSLLKMLTLANYENKEAYKKGSIIQLMNQAGFSTYWISNQRPVGWNENFITRIASAANERYFINSHADYLKTPFDLEVIPYLGRVLKNKDHDLFIVIHLLGTHNAYSKRFPADFNYFSGKAPLTISNQEMAHEIINDYDNAIRYNDYVLYQIIQKLRKEEASATMLYLSDHGEDVFQVNNSASHTETQGTYPMYDVPFIIWSSTDLNSEGWDTNRKYMLDDLIYSISDLLEIKFRGYEPERSIFNESFKFRERMIYNDQDYDNLFLRK